jgi:hypothetical protein
VSSPRSSEIVSYRAVFDLERRIYRLDRLRLNPSGVPIRGVVYCVALALAVLVLAALPVSGAVLGLLPWYLRDIALPVGGAALLSVVRVEGRCFHLAALSLARPAISGRYLRGLRRCSRVPPGQRWYPPELLVLPDGSDAQFRRMRFTGPGAALIAVSHECTAKRTRFAHLRAPRLALRTVGSNRELAQGRVLEVPRGVRMDVYRAHS